ALLLNEHIVLKSLSRKFGGCRLRGLPPITDLSASMPRLISRAALILIATATVSAAGGQTGPAPASPVRVAARPSGGAAVVRMGTSTVIQGNALSSTNGQLSHVIVRLRDARYGRIVETQLTDDSGMF